ncbi:MAG: AAA family ATPase [Candidatus Promineifilaceae bacterium]
MKRQFTALLALVEEKYPAWTRGEATGWVEDEIQYKHAAATQAQVLLSQSEYQTLLNTQQYDELISCMETLSRATNLLWRRLPRRGDTAILYADGLNKAEFALIMRDLLYGPASAPERLEQYARYAAANHLPLSWPFPTYLLFLLHPKSELFIKPEPIQWWLKFLGVTDVWTKMPGAAAYTAIRYHAHELKQALNLPDMISVQSLIWVAFQQAKQHTGRLTPKGQVELDVPLINETEPDYEFTKTALTIHEVANMPYTPTPTLRQTPSMVGVGPVKRRKIELDEIAAATGLPLDTLQTWLRAIERKGQAVLYGPPGTGKTYVARYLADYLAQDNGFVTILQFHPAYTYEDFIEGIRPQENSEGKLELKMTPGRFISFCELARRTPSATCVLILDEINRANLSRVFGELMYLLEYREERIFLAGSGLFGIPANVRIIGTMNTADRSIALVDHALRRRFAFLELAPDYELLRYYHRQHNSDLQLDGLIRVLQRLNSQIEKHYQVGVTFFMRPRLATELRDIWEMEILPYLDEYFFDQLERIEPFRWSRIAQELLNEA